MFLDDRQGVQRRHASRVLPVLDAQLTADASQELRDSFSHGQRATQKEQVPGLPDLLITNQFLDLVAENIDVAIRFGELADSSVVATRIGKSIRYVVATPEYLKGRKLPVEPADLERHDCVMLNARNNETDWDLVYGRKKARIRVSGPISSRDFNSISTFVYRGHGIGLLPSTYCDEALASGALIRLLPKWASAQIPVFAVYSNRKFLPLRLKVFLEALAAWKSPLWLRE